VPRCKRGVWFTHTSNDFARPPVTSILASLFFVFPRQIPVVKRRPVKDAQVKLWPGGAIILQSYEPSRSLLQLRDLPKFAQKEDTQLTLRVASKSRTNFGRCDSRSVVFATQRAKGMQGAKSPPARAGNSEPVCVATVGTFGGNLRIPRNRSIATVARNRRVRKPFADRHLTHTGHHQIVATPRSTICRQSIREESPAQELLPQAQHRLANRGYSTNSAAQLEVR
jgi:hypothetical protein